MRHTLLLPVLAGCFSQTIVFPPAGGRPAPGTAPDPAGLDTATPTDTGAGDSGGQDTASTAPTHLSDTPWAVFVGNRAGSRLGQATTVADLDGDGQFELVTVSLGRGAPLSRSALHVVAPVPAGTHTLSMGDAIAVLDPIDAGAIGSFRRLPGFDGPGDDAVALLGGPLQTGFPVFAGGAGPFAAARRSAVIRLDGDQATSWTDVASVGDTDGDGVAELGLVARTWARTSPNGGVWTSTGNVSHAYGVPAVPGPAAVEVHEDLFEVADTVGLDAVIPCGDRDGDGLADVIYAGTELSFVPGPLPGGGMGGEVAAAAAWQVAGLGSGAVAWVGDVNGDGAEDLLVGRPATTSDGRGAAWLLDPAGTLPAVLDDAPALFSGVVDGAGVGLAVSAAGDMDGDGAPEVWIGSDGGGAWLVDGAGRVLLHVDPGTPGSGRWITGGFDVTGDGAPDLVMADPDADLGGEAAGAIWVWAGVAR